MDWNNDGKVDFQDHALFHSQISKGGGGGSSGGGGGRDLPSKQAREKIRCLWNSLRRFIGTIWGFW